MSQNSKLRRLWWQFRLNPFIGPSAAGAALLNLLLPWIGLGAWSVAMISWAALWAVLESMAKHGWPRRRVRALTDNFYAVKDLSGVWRIFQRAPAAQKEPLPCRQVLRGLLADRTRLPNALLGAPGRYRALTHGTVLERLKKLPEVEILAAKPAYISTLEDTINQTAHGRCAKCTESCPFTGRRQPRQFYDVRFRIS